MEAKECTGRLCLEFRKRRDGKSYLASQYYKLPLQVMPPHYQDTDGTAFIYLLNPSGGILQGDKLLTEIVLEEGSDVLVATPSANKFYRMEEGEAIIENIFRVGDSCALEYLPECGIPFAGTKVSQQCVFYLQETSVLLTGEILTAGRTAMGEAFAYDYFNSKTKIYVKNELLIYDHMKLIPEETDLHGMGIFEGYSIIGSFYFYKKELPKELAGKLLQVADSYEHTKIALSSPMDDLIFIRLLGNSILETQKAMEELWGVGRFALLGKDRVSIRKY